MNRIKSNNSFQIEQSSKIAGRVMDQIERYDRRRFRIKIFLHTTLTIGAGLAIIPTLNYLWGNLSQSGFSSYASLIIYDSSYIMNHLSDLLLSVATSWPLPATILFVAIAAIFINSLGRTIRYRTILTNFQPQLS